MVAGSCAARGHRRRARRDRVRRPRSHRSLIASVGRWPLSTSAPQDGATTTGTVCCTRTACPARDRLEVYWSQFGTVELNASFYRWPPPQRTFASWRRRLPDGFTMSVKALRGLTHAKRLYAPETWASRLAAGWHELGERRGVLLAAAHASSASRSTNRASGHSLDLRWPVEEVGIGRVVVVSVLERNRVVVSGTAGAQPMVFAHGFGCDQNMWRYVAPAFEATNQVVLVRSCGRGTVRTRRRTRRRGPRRCGGYTDDVNEICGELCLHRCRVRRALSDARDDRRPGRGPRSLSGSVPHSCWWAPHRGTSMTTGTSAD